MVDVKVVRMGLIFVGIIIDDWMRPFLAPGLTRKSAQKRVLKRFRKRHPNT